MKALNIVLFSLLVAFTLIFAGCPSPLGSFNSTDTYETSATIDTSRMVFIEEDGSETPLLPPEEGGPEEIVDFAVVDDSASPARSIGVSQRVRVVVLGRRHGRLAVWVLYRYGGMIVLPNEGGDDTDLMVMVEQESWGLDGWEYDAKDVALSDDGKVIIGRYFRPNGWEFASQLGDVPAPSIGVWWSLFEKECVVDDGTTISKLVVSRARPMILMEEPTAAESVARHSGGRRWNYDWFEKILRYITERFASAILDASWNFMADVDGFVDPTTVKGGIPDGFYVAKGIDRYGIDSRVWFTTASMEDIVVDDESTSPPPLGPFPVVGPETASLFQDLGFSQSFTLDLADADPASGYTDVVAFGSDDLPSYLTLLSDGTVSAAANAIPWTGTAYPLSVSFYTLDADNNASVAFPVTINCVPYGS